MEDNFKSKYLKYKMKYLDLKNRQSAGGLFGNLFKTGAQVVSKTIAPVKQIAKDAGKELKTQAIQAAKDTGKELKTQTRQTITDLKTQAMQKTSDYINQIESEYTEPLEETGKIQEESLPKYDQQEIMREDYSPEYEQQKIMQ